MIKNIPEYLREISVNSCFELSAFSKGWSVWKDEIINLSSSNYQATDLLNIGDNLANIFKTTGIAGRSQSDVSGGGYGWEGLVCWYLNLCMIGSKGVAVRKISDLPDPLRDAISVNYGNFRSNTESDITVIIFPDKTEFSVELDSIKVQKSDGTRIPIRKNNDDYNFKPVINRLTEIYFDAFELCIIQCKTNWNDNAQIPMLWSMIYEATSFSRSSISIGRNGYSIHDLKKFSYSFCTVPSNSLESFKQNSTAVNRVRNLSGGNYWGYSSKSGIASSIKEIYNNNFRNIFLIQNQRNLISNNIKYLNNHLSYFQLN